MILIMVVRVMALVMMVITPGDDDEVEDDIG